MVSCGLQHRIQDSHVTQSGETTASYQSSRKVQGKAFGTVVEKVMLSNMTETEAQHHVKVITANGAYWCYLIVFKDTVSLCLCSCLSVLFQHMSPILKGTLKKPR